MKPDSIHATAEPAEGSVRSPEIRWVGELQRVDVKPGDRFVLSIDQIIPMETKLRLERIWKDFIGSDDTKILILERGMKLGVFGAASEFPSSVTTPQPPPAQSAIESIDPGGCAPPVYANPAPTPSVSTSQGIIPLMLSGTLGLNGEGAGAGVSLKGGRK